MAIISEGMIPSNGRINIGGLDTNKVYNIEEVMLRYKEEVEFIKTHVGTVIFTFIVTLIQRLSMFSIIYIIYRSLGFSDYTFFDLLAIQVCVQIAMEAVPLPGGAGLSESFMHNLFVIIFASKLADVGMLLTRAFNFYIPLIATGGIILIEYLYRKMDKIKIECFFSYIK